MKREVTLKEHDVMIAGPRVIRESSTDATSFHPAIIETLAQVIAYKTCGRFKPVKKDTYMIHHEELPIGQPDLEVARRMARRANLPFPKTIVTARCALAGTEAFVLATTPARVEISVHARMAHALASFGNGSDFGHLS